MAHLAAWLDQQEEAMAMPCKVAFAVRQSLEEALVNLIDHTQAAARETIDVELEWQDDMLTATVEDTGPPFDLRRAHGPRDNSGDGGTRRLRHPPDPRLCERHRL